MTAHFDVHLVRHGQSTWNAARRIQGQTLDVPLTALGESQAEQVASRLATCGARTVCTSDLRRSLQTALPIAGVLGVAVTVDPDLRERCLGRFEGQQSEQAWAAADAAWGDPRWRPPGGESIHDVCERIGRFLRRLHARANGSPVVVVTHGDTAGIALGLLRGFPADALPWTALANGEVVTVTASSAAGGKH